MTNHKFTSQRINQVHKFTNPQILIENPPSIIKFTSIEAQINKFMAEVGRRTAVGR